MNISVFGGSGFLGSHIADQLTERGHQVTIFDCNESSYLKDGQRMIVGDILDYEQVLAACKGADIIYNCAALSDLNAAKDRPVKTAQVNVLGNTYVLEAAKEVGAKRFVFASTVYVFSEKGSFYRASKQSCEFFIEAYQERYGLDYTILRYGSLYGRRADHTNGLYKMLRQALEDGCITYAGDQEAMREYIHVRDAARLSADVLDEKYKNSHFIITGQERIPVKAIMRMVAEMIPEEVELKFLNDPMYAHYVMTPYSFHPKLGHKLTANEHIDLGQGLMDCLAEIREKMVVPEMQSHLR